MSYKEFQNHQTYTQEEVLNNISILEIKKEELLLKRKELNLEIKEKKDAIKKWEELDKSQYKMF